MPSSRQLPPRVRAARAYARKLVNAADTIDYSQTRSRPMALVGPKRVPDYLDCSSAVTLIYEAAGFPDPNGRRYDGYGYCYEPSMRILTSDLRWRPAGEIEAGDELWAFDEYPDPALIPQEWASGRGRAGRRYRRAVVLKSFLSKKECVRVCVDTGETFICSTDHPWLTQTSTCHQHKWVTADSLLTHQLKTGGGSRSLVRPFLPWEADTSYEAGWLAGMFDGEGWVQNRQARGGRTSTLGITQTIGPTADRVVDLSRQYGSFTVATIERPGVQSRINLTSNGGGVTQVASFLGTIRPNRLIDNFNLEGGHVLSRNVANVASVEPVGEREVQSIQTTTRTYFAEGFAVHNTGTLVSNGRPIARSNIQPCDLVFYGHASSRPGFPAGAPTHVAMVMDRKGAIFTFGSDPGPSFRRIDYRLDLHSIRRYIRDLR